MTPPDSLALGTPGQSVRSARSAKTRDSIADALLDLIVEGNPRPTAKEIADRAGVSVRSVYVHFDDLEDLFCVAAHQHFTRVAPMLGPPATEGSLAERTRALVERRAGLYAKVGAVGRATQLQAPFSPTLARIVRDAYARSRKELERVFEPELDGLTPDARADLIATLDVLTGPAAWETLRDGHELSVDRAAACVIAAVMRQLEAAA